MRDQFESSFDEGVQRGDELKAAALRHRGESAAAAGVTAAELVMLGRCSGACMVATSDAKACTCVCRGETHGRLADVAMELGQGKSAWWEACRRGGWSKWLVDQHVVVVSNTGQFNAAYREQNKALGYALLVQRDGDRRFTVMFDTPERDETLWPEHKAVEAARNFIHALLLKRRARSGFYAVRKPEYGQVSGLRDLDEAKTVAVLLGECILGNHCGTVRALYVLLGQSDPVDLGLNVERLYPPVAHSEWCTTTAPIGPCPSCSRPAELVRPLDRYFHLDGSENDPCWVRILRGGVTCE